MEQEFIDMTPTWETAATILGQCLMNGEDPKALDDSFKEVVRMGRLLDQLIAERGSDNG